MTVQVTASGDYNFYDNGYEDDIGQDGTLGIYSGTFDPANLGNSCVASIDDDHTVTLAAGTYTFVLSSYSGLGDDENEGDVPGNFYYTITGPGRVGPPVAAVTAVPTLSEWSMMLLAVGAAGMGMRRLRRKV